MNTVENKDWIRKALTLNDAAAIETLRAEAAENRRRAQSEWDHARYQSIEFEARVTLAEELETKARELESQARMLESDAEAQAELERIAAIRNSWESVWQLGDVVAIENPLKGSKLDTVDNPQLDSVEFALVRQHPQDPQLFYGVVLADSPALRCDWDVLIATTDGQCLLRPCAAICHVGIWLHTDDLAFAWRRARLAEPAVEKIRNVMLRMNTGKLWPGDTYEDPEYEARLFTYRSAEHAITEWLHNAEVPEQVS